MREAAETTMLFNNKNKEIEDTKEKELYHNMLTKLQRFKEKSYI